ncbi:DUF421 domain-containing protein [Serpentinicella sp. ANB-PHB4]|uniref:DUF421 domain-containing protein n=1 Tax=Serpentinicella sp. ANB-PHB4 TaxID=3074076 RepID=UPI0028550BE7|nr:YetF domain-containing protein [Serpentinicella sp. ANB-PHB4]MDR5659044.1 DUF421 domain-containing protein [Serpentinicella sp. ANB-PHB4]
MVIFLTTLTFMFLLLIIIIRLLGKSLLAQLTPHDFLTIVFLAYLAFSPIDIQGIHQSITGMVVIACIYIIISKISTIPTFNKLIVGEATIIIKNGEILYNNLKKARYPLIELLSAARVLGYPDLKDIHYAILEPNGELSILPKKDVAPLTPKHLNIETTNMGQPVAIIVEGVVQHKNLKSLGKDIQWLKNELTYLGYSNFKEVLYASINDSTLTLRIIPSFKE